MAIALRQNYATASTDDGTAGDIPGFLLDPNKVTDWRVNAVHETAENAQSIVQGFYGTAPRHSYFTGCSKGGSEASAEMQRFPDDFDGIVGGACAFGGTHNQVDSVWNIVQTNGNATNTTPLLDEDALTLLHSAVLAACPQEGGVETDNYLNDPRDCHFDHIQIEGEHGFGKPEERAYNHAMEVLGVGPHETWMVGDNLEWEVISPQRLGIYAIWHDGYGVGLPPDSPIRPDRNIHRLSELLL